MGIVASKGDSNTPLLNLCKERKELIKAARDARYHLARSHLLYFKSLLDFSKALKQFLHKDLVVIPYSDDDSSSSDIICSGSDSDSDTDSDSDSDSDCIVCDQPQTAPLSNNDDQSQRKPVVGDGTCGASNNGQEGMEKSREGLGFEGTQFVSDPSEDEMKSSQHPNDILGFYKSVYNMQQCEIIELDHRDDEVESDGFREIREREGIPDLEPESDYNSLIRKNKKKNKKKKKKKNVRESSSVASEIDKRDVEANTCNGQVADETDNSNEACAQETENTPEIVTEEVTRSDEEVEVVARSDEEVSDEAYESSSSCFSESSGSGLTDLRKVVERINSICGKAAGNSEVSELLEVSRVVYHQPLGSQFKGFASRVIGSSGTTTRDLVLKRRFRLDDLAVSLSMTLEKLYMWEKKLHAEVTAEEKLRVAYEKAYKILNNLDQNGAESSELYEAETLVKLHLSKVNVSVRAVESISMRIHKIRDEELSFQVIEIINGFKTMWRFLAKCHHKQFRVIARSKSCVHIVENGSSSRKATQQVEKQIRRYRESLKGYIDAHRGFVKLLNEWLNRIIMEDDETETEAPEIFRVCSEWLREIENVDTIKVLSVVEEMRLRFQGLGFKQVEEEKQRMRTERLSKELEKKTKELEEIRGTRGSSPTSNMVEPELLFLRESVTQETEKHERLIRELNDAVSMSLQECMVPVFEALGDFCFANFKAYQNIVIVTT